MPGNITHRAANRKPLMQFNSEENVGIPDAGCQVLPTAR